MTEQPLSDVKYSVELTYSEIHLILQAMDSHLDQYPHLREIKAVGTIYGKLEPIHGQHNRAVRDRLLNRTDER